MSLRGAAVLAFFCASVTAFVPAARATTRHNAAMGDAKYRADASGTRAHRRSVVCTEKEETVKIDEDMVRVVAAAASADADQQQQRIDAALAELGRSGNLASAAAAGGFSEQPPEQPAEDVVPVWLTVAPPAIGGFSVVLFVLNTFGVFGEGPDLNMLG